MSDSRNLQPKLAGNFKNKKAQYFPLFLWWHFGMAARGFELTTARIQNRRYASAAMADL